MISARRREQKRKRKVRIASYFMIFLMVLAVAGFVATGPIGSSEFSYNGIDFYVRSVNGNAMLMAEINDQEIGFYFDPFQAETLTVPDNMRETILNAQEIIVTSLPFDEADPTLDLRIQNALYQDLDRFTDKRITRATTKQDFEFYYLIKDCSDASRETPVLYMPLDMLNYTSTGIFEHEPYCYYLNAAGPELLLMRDYLIYLLNEVFI